MSLPKVQNIMTIFILQPGTLRRNNSRRKGRFQSNGVAATVNQILQGTFVQGGRLGGMPFIVGSQIGQKWSMVSCHVG